MHFNAFFLGDFHSEDTKILTALLSTSENFINIIIKEINYLIDLEKKFI